MFPILKSLKEYLIISGILVLSEGTNVNYVAVGDTFNLTFKYSPKIDALIWKRNAVTNLHAVAVNKSTGNDCLSSAVASPEGFQFYCEDGGGRYTLGITSKSSDMGNNFTTSKDDGPFSYIPFDNSDVDPNKFITCNQPPTEMTNFVLECTTACTNNAVVKLTYQSVKSGAVEKDLANPVNMTSTVCNGFTTMQIFSFTYNINQNHPILGKFNSSDNGFKIFAVVMFPGTTTVVTHIVTNFSYIKPIDSVTTVEPTTQISSSRMSSEPPTTSLSSPSSSLSSTSSGQDGAGSPSTVTNPTPTYTATTPTPSPLTTTELIIVIVCSCVGFLLLVVLVVCCVILSIRRKNRKRRPPENKPYSDNSVTLHPYHHSLKTETEKTSSSNPGSRQPSSSVRPELQYTNYGYYDRPDDRHTYRDYDNNLRQYRNYNNVYNDHRPYRRDDHRRQREDINLTPYRLYYQPHQYHYL